MDVETYFLSASPVEKEAMSLIIYALKDGTPKDELLRQLHVFSETLSTSDNRSIIHDYIDAVKRDYGANLHEVK